MAMRPTVRRHALVIIVFALVQWGFVMLALHHNWWHLDKNGRILAFCASAFGGEWLLIIAVLYMVIKGNDGKNDSQDVK
ncbi:MAG: hypothetical protein VX875_11600 [Pseudomonadota bacterium]|nr:hypothetical protein [Pseudomonadota bacterium]